MNRLGKVQMSSSNFRADFSYCSFKWVFCYTSLFVMVCQLNHGFKYVIILICVNCCVVIPSMPNFLVKQWYGEMHCHFHAKVC